MVAGLRGDVGGQQATTISTTLEIATRRVGDAPGRPG